MTNGWELANGFNPLDPVDSILDRDDDGISNLAEYQENTDPSELPGLDEQSIEWRLAGYFSDK